MRLLICAPTLLLLVSIATRLQAGFLTINNPSFELPVNNASFFQDSGEFFTDRVIAGWTGTGQFAFSEGVLVAKQGVSYSGITATDGLQVAYSNGGVISQILADTLQTNSVYTLQVDVGDRLGTPFPGYRIGLYAGGTLLAEDHSTIGAINGGFITSTVNYNSGASNPFAGQALEIRLTSVFVSSGLGGVQANFDNVRLSVTGVPEPSSIVMFGLSVICVTPVQWLRAKLTARTRKQTHVP